MSLIRTVILLSAAVMLLPTEKKDQAEFSTTAARTAEQTATFCDRNPSTCASGRDIWGLFLRKAEYGVELGARLLRQQLLGGPANEPQPAQTPHVQSAQPALPQGQPPIRLEPALGSALTSPQVPPLPPAQAPAPRRSAQQIEQPPRWR